MISLLSKIFIKNRDDVTDSAVRKAYGSLCSALGIVLNVLLFAGKYIAGAVSGSIAITADAFNNLSDAGSSAISLVGFHLSSKKPDLDHPFGHGRLEYISGLCVAALILVMGVELLISSVQKIITPEPVEIGLLPAAILIVSIAVKVYMSAYNRSVGKKISSSAMLATATDSLSDSIATTVVLISMGVSYLFDVNIDGYAGVLVALFILWAGIGVARDTLSPLLGQAPDPGLVQRIEDIVMGREEIIGMHDLVVHDYGPGRLMISLHAEVDGRGDIFELHDAVDVVERTLAQELGCGTYNDEAVFERYMESHGISKLKEYDEIKVGALELKGGVYCVHCTNREGFHHLLPVVDNVIYDRRDDSRELYVVAVYKKQE